MGDGGFLDVATLAMQQTAAYGQQHQARMFQPQYSGFDTVGVNANNPLMSMGSQFGEVGTMAAMMAQTMLAGNPQFGPIMQRLAMPPGTDVAAASRFRQFQMTSAQMGMGGITDTYAAAFGMKASDPGYGILRMLPMLDPMAGGMFTKIANMMDENLLTMQGASSVVEASQFRDTMGMLDPRRAAMLQQSLMANSRANGAGSRFNQVNDFGRESEFRLRNQVFTAGFNNDEMAMATLFAERQGIADTETMGRLRAPENAASTRLLARAQLAKYRGKKSPDEVADDDPELASATEDLIRNEGSVGGGSLTAQAARRIQQSLLQSASMPQLLSFMESEHIAPRNQDDVNKLDDTIIQLQALGRAAGMATEAMIKNATMMQQQYGGTVMYHANALAAGQSMDRNFRMQSGTGGYTVNTELSEQFSGAIVQRQAEAAQSQYMDRIAYLGLTNPAEFTALVNRSPAEALKYIENMGPEAATRARVLDLDPAKRVAGQRIIEDGANRANLNIMMDQAILNEQMRQFRGVGAISVGEGATKRVLSSDTMANGFSEFMSERANRDAVALIYSDANYMPPKEIQDSLQRTMGLSVKEFRETSFSEKAAGGGLQGMVQTYHLQDRRAADIKASEHFVGVQKALADLSKMNVVSGGTAMMMSRLVDPNFDVMAYGAKKGFGDALYDIGLVSKENAGKATDILNSALTTSEDKQKFRDAVSDFRKNAIAYAKTEVLGEDSEERKAARTELLKSVNTMQGYGLNVDPGITMNKEDREKANALGTNTAALNKVGEALNTLASMFSGGGSGPLATVDGKVVSGTSDRTKGDNGSRTVIELRDKTTSGVVATVTAGDPAAGAPEARSAPR